MIRESVINVNDGMNGWSFSVDLILDFSVLCLLIAEVSEDVEMDDLDENIQVEEEASGMLCLFIWLNSIVLMLNSETPVSGQPLDRPSEYLRERCPLCFGGENWGKKEEL